MGRRGVTAPRPASIQLFPYYTPSFDLALTGAIVFGCLAAVHGWLAFKTRTVYFGISSKAALTMTIGMILRIVFATTPAENVTVFSWPFAAMSLLLTMPGSIVGLVLMMTQTRLTWWITPAQDRTLGNLWVPPMYQSLFFATPQAVADAIGFIGSGILLIRPAPPHVASAGAVMDMLVWMALAGVVLRYAVISRRRWPPIERSMRDGSRRLSLALSVSAVLLAIRGVTQVLERDAAASLQADPPLEAGALPLLATEEWPIYAFDYLPIAAILVVMAVYYPGLYLPRRLTGFRLRTVALVREEEEENLCRSAGGTSADGLSGGMDLEEGGKTKLDG
ncbi:hypothetical protein B0T26DRAFT_647724 [Lasiosphaeria miniovina]|uniref:Uncharacterized protein n=1 Tax=Lasiosphaeria miniovina TaxID=1954250 RepID=A0AA40DXQ5_9PEZI|nr:uncharacterized protein B0T26DRAFT_647724 [Lasiosphaeria miniovina]KAK0716901.1 hypothetical protein B0T26DRAFT_647724 [Lasiosphaeria miniovina]